MPNTILNRPGAAALLAIPITILVACQPADDTPPDDPVARSGSIGLPASADAYVRSGGANKNQGYTPVLSVQKSGKHRTLVRFDQEDIAAAVDGNLLSATLELSVVDNGGNWGSSGRPVDLHRVTTEWSEVGATWNCAHDSNTSNSAADCTTSAWEMGSGSNPWAATPSASLLVENSTSGTVTFDVTADVQAFLDGVEVNHGWILKKAQEGQNGSIEFASNQSATPPRLVLDFDGPGGGDSGGPATESEELAAVEDAYLKGGSANKNQGDEDILRLRKSGPNRALVRFDGGEIDEVVEGELVSARIELEIGENANNWGDGGTLLAHRVTEAWTELGVTWNCAIDADPSNSAADCSGSTAWDMDGGEGQAPYVYAPSGWHVIHNGDTGIASLDVTEDVQQYLDGGDLFGWLLRKADEGESGRVDFASRETATPPKLVLDWEPPSNEWLIYVADGAGGDEIWATTVDGSRQVKLTDHLTSAAVINWLTVSWAGDRIGFQSKEQPGGGFGSSRHFYTMDVDGGDFSHLVSGGGTLGTIPGWSGDDDWFYYVKESVCSDDLYRIPSTGGAIEAVWTAHTMIGGKPNPADDSLILALTRSCGSPMYLRLIDLDAGTANVLPGLSADDGAFTGEWSRDGTLVTYQNRSPGNVRHISIHDLSPGGAQDVYTPGANISLGYPVFGADNDTVFFWQFDNTAGEGELYRLTISSGDLEGIGVTTSDVNRAFHLGFGVFAEDPDANDNGIGDGIE